MLEEQDHERILALNDIILTDTSHHIHEWVLALLLLSLHDLSLPVAFLDDLLSELIDPVLLPS